MKHAKKVLALLLVLVMSLALLSATALAAGTGKIVIENATAGMEYKLYKVFDASYTDSTENGQKPLGATYTITKSSKWFSMVTATGSPFTLSPAPQDGDTADTVYTVSISEGQQEAVATWFQQADVSKLTADASVTPQTNLVEFDNLDKGYYFIKSAVGATVTLTHANETRKVIDKNQKPGWGTAPGDETKPGGKYIKTGANGTGENYGSLGTADVGGDLSYKIDVFSATNYQGDKMIKEYIIEDTESPAVFMHFSTVRVWVNGSELTKGWVEGVDETSNTSHAIGSSTTPATSKNDADWYVENADNTDSKFSIHINWLKSDGTFKFDNSGKSNVIKITYEGVLKSKGVIYGDNGNNNTATLFVLPENSENREQVGDPSTAKAVTYSGSLFKCAAQNKPLSGAEFTIAREGENDPLKLYPSKDYDGVYYLANEENWNSGHVEQGGLTYEQSTSKMVTTIVSPADGYIIIRGLAGGRYTVTETKAPGGYTKLAEPLVLTLQQRENGVEYNESVQELTKANKDGVSKSFKFENVHVRTIVNQSGTVLPETGSTGTRMLIIFGAFAVLCTGVILVANKRMRRESF